MNLAFRFPILFWNCACLIADSGGAEAEMDEQDDVSENCIDSYDYSDTIEEFGSENDDEDEEDEDEEEEVKKIAKKKVKATNYGRIL